MWPRIAFDYRLNPSVNIATGVEWRIEDRLSRTDCWVLSVNPQYRLLPFMKLGAGYEWYYCNQETDSWNTMHCLYGDCILSTRIQRFKLSLRERFQYTVSGNWDEYRLRSRLKAAYVPPKSAWEPYVLIEMYQSLHTKEHFEVTRMRYWGGIVLTLTDDWTMDLFYCRQHESDSRKDIIGIEWGYKF